jgi:uncharacterized protein YbjQ (UPF0145 family)
VKLYRYATTPSAVVALWRIEKQAEQLGADAVIGVDIDYGSVGSNMLMISASGTAVKLA